MQRLHIAESESIEEQFELGRRGGNKQGPANAIGVGCEGIVQVEPKLLPRVVELAGGCGIARRHVPSLGVGIADPRLGHLGSGQRDLPDRPADPPANR